MYRAELDQFVVKLLDKLGKKFAKNSEKLAYFA
jgi:hypothetical protein